MYHNVLCALFVIYVLHVLCALYAVYVVHVLYVNAEFECAYIYIHIRTVMYIGSIYIIQ